MSLCCPKTGTASPQLSCSCVPPLSKRVLLNQVAKQCKTHDNIVTVQRMAGVKPRVQTSMCVARCDCAKAACGLSVAHLPVRVLFLTNVPLKFKFSMAFSGNAFKCFLRVTIAYLFLFLIAQLSSCFSAPDVTCLKKKQTLLVLRYMFASLHIV